MTVSRLATEFQRLYAAGPEGSVRALVIDVGRPSDWELVGAMWRGVQLDLALPAPGIVIAGENSYQLWFSLAQGVRPEAAQRFLDGLRTRWLAGLAAPRVRVLLSPPGVPAEVPPEVPAEVKEGQWSAFVAPDLAPVFVEATWLDIPPSAEGQADLLKSLKSISPQQWDEAMALLAPVVEQDPAPEAMPATFQPMVSGAASAPSGAQNVFSSSTGFTDPRAFLTHVMNDGSVPMALRIDAAKALIPGAEKT